MRYLSEEEKLELTIKFMDRSTEVINSLNFSKEASFTELLRALDVYKRFLEEFINEQTEFAYKKGFHDGKKSAFRVNLS